MKRSLEYIQLDKIEFSLSWPVSRTPIDTRSSTPGLTSSPRPPDMILNQGNADLVKRTGDDILATFDGPGRAVRCALALSFALSKSACRYARACTEIRGSDAGGIAVHAAARVMARSASNEALVSRVVADLVGGAGLKFPSADHLISRALRVNRSCLRPLMKIACCHFAPGNAKRNEMSASNGIVIESRRRFREKTRSWGRHDKIGGAPCGFLQKPQGVPEPIIPARFPACPGGILRS
jgi:hypothetical protein